MTISPKIPRIASIVAFMMAGLAVVSALMGPIVLLAFAVIPLAAGIGILRRRVWSAYGFALCLFAELLVMPVMLIRSGGLTTSVPQTIASIVLTLTLTALFLLAGRSLAASGSRRVWASPWIAVSAVFTIPFLFVQPFARR